MTKSTESINQPSICEACGAEFGCGAKLDGCWCAEIVLTEEITKNLRAKFKACLCPKCLGSFASNEKRASLSNSVPAEFRG